MPTRAVQIHNKNFRETLEHHDLHHHACSPNFLVRYPSSALKVQSSLNGETLQAALQCFPKTIRHGTPREKT